jgi:rhodanese-related sulfurtransferase
MNVIGQAMLGPTVNTRDAQERSLLMKFKVLLFAALAILATGRGAFAGDAVDAVASSDCGGVTEEPASKAEEPELPKEKQTTLGLYLTAKEAYDKWKTDPGKVNILDVRTPEEYVFIGHPTMAWNVPVTFQTYQWDDGKRKLPMKPNPDFVAWVKEIVNPTDILLVMCRSGGRSALAVNQLAEAGFRNVYNIIDGMEGDLVDDPGSVFQGQRMKNGWKNSGLPWTYELAPERMRLPEQQ